MSLALTTGVSGLKASEKMLDVAGNNIANLNTTAFKSSTVTFSELLSQTMQSGSQPAATLGGTNPQQVGSGVGIAGITRNLSQGNIVGTGKPLDMAIDGAGYFTLNDGQQNVYTRIGSFGVDANSSLVDPATGYHVQRIGSEGEQDGFQTPGVSNISIPYNTTLPAKATGKIVVGGNLSADSANSTKQFLNSNIAYTVDGNAAQADTRISTLEQFSGDFAGGQTGTLTITGTQKDGTAISAGNTLSVDADTTMSDLITQINALLPDSTASLTGAGKIQITDNESGYSKTDINLSYTPSTGGDDNLTTPGYFAIETAGGNEVKNINMTVYDVLGGAHTLNAAFVRTDTPNMWDMVLTSISGDVNSLTQRRIEGITFATGANAGAYNGLADPTQAAMFGIEFGQDSPVTQNINVDLGTVGALDGITQFSGSSTAGIKTQDGYMAGQLASLSVGQDGVIVGAFTNSVKKNIATIQMALFQNAAGLEAVGKGYYVTSGNSGEAMATQASSGGTGKIWGNSLEKSNVDVATEFVTMIEAQNAYQANARTISVANSIMTTLTNLIR
jgi:flagellar hook protein FlgE